MEGDIVVGAAHCANPMLIGRSCVGSNTDVVIRHNRAPGWFLRTPPVPGARSFPPPAKPPARLLEDVARSPPSRSTASGWARLRRVRHLSDCRISLRADLSVSSAGL